MLQIINSNFRARMKYYFCGLYLLILTGTIALISTVLGIIPSFFGYGGYVNYISFLIHYKMFTTVLGVEAEFDEESKAIFNQIKGPAILVTNHQTGLDIALLGSLMNKNTVMVSKKSLLYVPLLGVYMWMTGAIFLNKSKKSKPVSHIDQIVDTIHKKKVSVWIFPEGTRSHLREPDLLPFKSGAFHMAVRANVPIVPIVFGNYHHIYDAKNATLKSGKIPCKVLSPISTDNIGSDQESIQRLSNECRNRMLNFLDEPYSKKSL